MSDLAIALAEWLLAGVLLVIAGVAWLAARNRAEQRAIANEEMQLKTLREFRFRAEKRAANTPRPDPVMCGRQIRRPLPHTKGTTDLGTERTEARALAPGETPSVPNLYVLIDTVKSAEHFEHRVSRSIPPQQ